MDLVPEDLKKPELTANWEMKLSRIARGELRPGGIYEGNPRILRRMLTDEIKAGERRFPS